MILIMALPNLIGIATSKTVGILLSTTLINLSPSNKSLDASGGGVFLN
jgi:hypothetical protein